jgi:F-type H+-transporting ATPase subunit gamma
MKAVAAASINDYERAVAALGDYFATIERGLGACFRDPDLQPTVTASFNKPRQPCIVVFGTDQGLVGRFNDIIAEFALNSTFMTSPSANSDDPSRASSHSSFSGQQPLVWAVGERLNERLTDAGLTTQAHFEVPGSVKSITPLITTMTELHLFYNRPGNGPTYGPVTQRLLPLDQVWRTQLTEKSWPTNNLPELLGDKAGTLGALIREYLFVSLFRASAESLSSENASRLAAMQRADKNIEELLATLRRNYHRLRQAGIDEEMFDVIAGSTTL